MAMSVGNSTEDGAMCDINTTPLIDVMLVLLIMFIITIPVMTHAVKLDMPRPTDAPPLPVPPEVITIEIDFDGARFPGYLRAPAHARGCVLLINGLDSAKEVELAQFAEGFLQRGLAVFFFDGPGHGVRPGNVSMRRFSSFWCWICCSMRAISPPMR